MCVCIYGHLRCFHVLTIVSSAANDVGRSPHLDLSFTSKWLPSFCSAIHSFCPFPVVPFLSPGWCLCRVHLKSSVLSSAFLPSTPASPEGHLRATGLSHPSLLFPGRCQNKIRHSFVLQEAVSFPSSSILACSGSQTSAKIFSHNLMQIKGRGWWRVLNTVQCPETFQEDCMVQAEQAEDHFIRVWMKSICLWQCLALTWLSVLIPTYWWSSRCGGKRMNSHLNKLNLKGVQWM